MTNRAKQALSLMLIVMMLITMIPLTAAADDTGVRSAEVCKTKASAMTLDGKVTDGEAWDLVSWSADPFYTIGGTAAPAGSGVKFKTLWASDETNAYLYFLIDVADTTLDSTGRAWNADNVRIFLNEDGTPQDGDKCKSNQDNYGTLYAASEFMSYVTHDCNSKGFDYKTAKKANGSGYVVEVRYTFQNAAKAVAGAQIRTNFEADYGIPGGVVQTIWSKNADKWSDYSNKDCYVHAGTLTLSDKTAQVPATPTMNVLRTNAADMTLDGTVTAGEAWDGADWNTNTFRQIGAQKVPEGSAVRFKTLWATDADGAYLYFLVDLDDAILNATGRAWNQDNVLIFLDEDGIGEDSAKPQRNQDNYGSIYASSEFISYAPNSYSSKGFAYAAAKKEDGSGYMLEVRYTYQNAALAAADAEVRANLAVVFADENNSNNPAQFVWSFDADKWASGLKDKTYFGHTGTLKLSDRQAVIPSSDICMDGVQTTSVTGSGSFDARLVASVNLAALENADRIEFRVSAVYVENNTQYTVGEKTYSVNTVFASFLAGEDTVAADAGDAFALLIIKGIPATVTVTVTVTPQIVYSDGSTATGKTVTCTFSAI